MDSLQRTCVRICLTSLLVASLVGCGKTESEYVESQGVRARIDVIAQGDGHTDVNARLQVGEGGLFRTDLELSPGDRLVAYANGLAREMSKRKSIFDVIFGDLFGILLGTTYTTTLPLDDNGILFQIALERSSKTSVRNSNVTLPDAFSITTADDLVYADSDAVSVNWQPFDSPDKMSIEYRFECADVNFSRLVGSYSVATLDTGQFGIPVTEILTKGGQSAMADFTNGCDLEITLERKRKGRIDPDFGGGGLIYARQRRMLEAAIAAPPL